MPDHRSKLPEIGITYHLAMPPPRISAGGWLLFRPASIRTPAPLPTDSRSKITSTLTKKNYASQD